MYLSCAESLTLCRKLLYRSSFIFNPSYSSVSFGTQSVWIPPTLPLCSILWALDCSALGCCSKLTLMNITLMKPVDMDRSRRQILQGLPVNSGNEPKTAACWLYQFVIWYEKYFFKIVFFCVCAGARLCQCQQGTS